MFTYYRPGVGCLTSADILKETAMQYNRRKSNVHCCLIDYSKAYDRVNYRILLSKLIDSRVPRDIVLLMKCIFENFNIGVRFNNACSEMDFKAGNGVRQGGVCSGVLFTFYINDILEVVSRMSIGCSLGSSRINIIAYADDLTILAPSRTALQFLVNIVAEMSLELCLSINSNKTQYIVFVCERKWRDLDFFIVLNDINITRVYMCKYLGMYFNDFLSLSNDIEKCYKSFLAQFNSMFYKFNFIDKNQL